MNMGLLEFNFSELGKSVVDFFMNFNVLYAM